MAYALDAFNRANENPLASPWANSIGGLFTAGVTLVSNTAAGVGGVNGLSQYSTGTWSRDQVCEAIVGALAAGTAFAGVCVRLNTTASGYILQTDGTATTLIRYDIGVATNLVTGIGTVANGDKLTIKVTGSNIECFKNGARVATATDSNLTAGNPGILAAGVATLDNFYGSDVAGAASPVPIWLRGIRAVGFGGLMLAKVPLLAYPAFVAAGVVGQPFSLWPVARAQIEPEEDVQRANHTLLHRFRTGFQTVGQQQQVLRWKSTQPGLPEEYEVKSARPDLHLYRTGFQTVGQGYRQWPRTTNRVEAEEYTPPKPVDLTPFRGSAPVVTTSGAPWYLWKPAPQRIEPEEYETRKAGDLTPFRNSAPVVTAPGAPWYLWAPPIPRIEPEEDARRADHTLLNRYRVGYQTVGQPWLYWIKPPNRVDADEYTVPGPASLAPFRQITITASAGQPWFMWPSARGDQTVEQHPAITLHALALEPFRPHQAFVPVVVDEARATPGRRPPLWLPNQAKGEHEAARLRRLEQEAVVSHETPSKQLASVAKNNKAALHIAALRSNLARNQAAIDSFKSIVASNRAQAAQAEVARLTAEITALEAAQAKDAMEIEEIDIVFVASVLLSLPD